MTLCADLNEDGFVNFTDLAEFKSQFGRSAYEIEHCPAASFIEVELTWPAETIAGGPIAGLVYLRLNRRPDGCWTATLSDEAGRESEAVFWCPPITP
jgi:hypothetical protein